MEVYTDRNPSWLQWIAPAAFDDVGLFRIVMFDLILYKLNTIISATGN